MLTTRRRSRTGLGISAILVSAVIAIFLLPETPHIPVSGASAKDWHPQSFWYYPWGRSGAHKGIDIFAKAGTPVVAATQGLVVHTGEDSMGGNIVLVLGGKWRFHYYAHLQRIDTQALRWVRAGEAIGTVGSSGNAKGKPPHLHYAIRTPYPQPWLYDAGVPQAWNKLFFVDPNAFLP
jgi:murein DD-endopeptidase MepM/ murein hydrolase activator NlpD